MSTHVFVVDDEPDLRLLVRLALEPRGYRITEAATGEEAVANVADVAPDVILLDIKLPGMDGWQVVEHLKRRGHDTTPIIMLSAHSSDAALHRAQDAGCSGYIAKPFKMAQLEEMISSALATNGEGAP